LSQTSIEGAKKKSCSRITQLGFENTKLAAEKKWNP
jgi:hypothetical protein